MNEFDSKKKFHTYISEEKILILHKISKNNIVNHDFSFELNVLKPIKNFNRWYDIGTIVSIKPDYYADMNSFDSLQEAEEFCMINLL